MTVPTVTNKDPFFDRDLENFKRLHADGGISLGVVITRGASLQDAMRSLVRRFADETKIDSHNDMERIGLNPTRRQIAEVKKRVERARNPIPFRDAWVDHFVSDKFGTATTHWSKLDERIQRGVGNPCPLVLIGLPASIVTFGESASVVEALLDDGEKSARERILNRPYLPPHKTDDILDGLHGFGGDHLRARGAVGQNRII